GAGWHWETATQAAVTGPHLERWLQWAGPAQPPAPQRTGGALRRSLHHPREDGLGRRRRLGSIGTHGRDWSTSAVPPLPLGPVSPVRHPLARPGSGGSHAHTAIRRWRRRLQPPFQPLVEDVRRSETSAPFHRSRGLAALVRASAACAGGFRLARWLFSALPER